MALPLCRVFELGPISGADLKRLAGAFGGASKPAAPSQPAFGALNEVPSTVQAQPNAPPPLSETADGGHGSAVPWRLRRETALFMRGSGRVPSLRPCTTSFHPSAELLRHVAAELGCLRQASPEPAVAAATDSFLSGQSGAEGASMDMPDLEDYVALALNAWSRKVAAARDAAQGPVAQPLPACTPAAALRSAQRSLYVTPMEGVPERFSMSVRPAKRLLDSPCLAEPDASCSTAGATPIEGVPERLTKRSRPSPLPPARMALASNPAGADQGPGGAQHEAQPGTPQDEAADAAAGLTLEGVAEEAAAATRAARAAMRALAAHEGVTASGGDTPVASAGQPAPSNSHSSGTPGVVKMQRAAADVMSAVRRAAEAMGGVPAASPPPPGGLPPRPPSVARASAAVAQAAAAAAAAVAEAQALIRRAPSGVLVFPSPSPSPEGASAWWPQAEQPGPLQLPPQGTHRPRAPHCVLREHTGATCAHRACASRPATRSEHHRVCGHDHRLARPGHRVSPVHRVIV
jgi:hypothetical protein